MMKKSVFSQNWWVVLFVALCGGVYAHAIQKKQLVITSLDSHLDDLKAQHVQLLEYNQELKAQIHSQSDPAWIELTLMKGLGLVPEGQTKVYFESAP